MSALRWTLGITAGAFAIGWIFLVMAGNTFRGSLGASQNALWKGVLPVAAAGVLLASVYLARETLFVAGLGILYSLGWLYFYYQTAWKAVV